MKLPIRLFASLLVALGLLAGTAGATHPGAKHENMDNLFFSPTGAVNSDLAFWGDRAYAGNYGGFRIFDISNPADPELLKNVSCFGPQNDVSVWENDILVLSIDAVLRSPKCGSRLAPNPESRNGWEGLRIFDVSDPANPVHIASVYQDCGSHTHTMVPDLGNDRLLIYNQSYSLRPGPTCGPKRGPQAGRSPLHGVLQIVEIPLANPAAAQEIAEKPINYPGDPDNQFHPAEHGLTGPFFPLRACHDSAVILGKAAPGSQPGDLGLAAGACAEQAQLWRIDSNGMPRTENPLFVFDNPVDENGATGNPNDTGTATDFWHSATFTWDGQIVNFSDESFGDGCPPVTPIGFGATAPNSDTGRTYFLNLSGTLLSQFMIPRTEPVAYCSTHQGNVVNTTSGYFLAQAWYMGGADIVDFTDPTSPTEVAFFDFNPPGATGGDNWSHYWYQGPAVGEGGIATYGQDGVHNPATGRGFEVFRAFIDATVVPVDHLNPQTQD